MRPSAAHKQVNACANAKCTERSAGVQPSASINRGTHTLTHACTCTHIHERRENIPRSKRACARSLPRLCVSIRRREHARDIHTRTPRTRRAIISIANSARKLGRRRRRCSHPGDCCNYVSVLAEVSAFVIFLCCIVY